MSERMSDVTSEPFGHHIVIRAEPGRPESTSITIDGQPLKACKRLELHMEAGHALPVVVIEVFPGLLDVDLPDAVLAALDATGDETVTGAYEEPARADRVLMRLASQVGNAGDEPAEHPAHTIPGEAR